MKVKIFFSLFLFILSPLHFYSQISQQWVRKYNGPGINKGDIATSIVTDANSNIYVTGQVSGYGADLDYTTIKYNSNGIQQWLTKYHGPLDTSNNYATAIAVDASGNVYVTGLSAGIGTYNDFATIKYNSAGIQQWVARFNGAGNSNDNGRAIAIDDSGNVYVTGESYNTSSLYDFATIKYNSSGVQQWASVFNGPGNNTDQPTALAIDQSHNVFVTGYTISGGVIKYATVKYNPSGIQQWVSIYNGSANTTSISNAIVVDHLGYVYITGRSNQTGTGEDIVTIKYNPSTGDSIWVQKYNSSANYPDEGYGITVDRYNNIFVTGASNNLVNASWGVVDIKYNSSGVQQWAINYAPPGRQTSYGKKILVDSTGNSYIGGYSLVVVSSLHTEDYLAMKVDSNGVLQWSNFYNGPGNDRDEGYGLAIDNAGNSFITGLSYAGFISGSCDYATVKYNSSGVQQWVARYNNPVNGNDFFSAMKIDKLGNIYVAGTSDGQSTGQDIVLLKFNSIGDTLWVRRYNSPFNSIDISTCMDIDSNGNIYVAGGSWSPDFQNNRFITLKYNSSGTLLWSSPYYAGGYANIASSIATDEQGNVYVLGIAGSTFTGHFLLIKYNSNGDTVWTRTTNSSTNPVAKKVITDKDGYIFITGKLSSDIYTVKYNQAGDTIWTASYNGIGNNADMPNDICIDKNGNMYITGYSRQTSSYGSEDYVTIKYNSSGIQQWVRLYNGTGNFYDEGKSISVDTSGNVYVTGVSYTGNTNYDIATIKYDSLGNLVWIQVYNSAGNNIDRANNMILDQNENVYISGCNNSSAGYNFEILKYNSMGAQQWNSSYTANDDSSYSNCLLNIDTSGNIYLAGSSLENGTDYDIVLIKYSQLIGIKQISNSIPKQFHLYQNYPNPFNPTTRIKFDIPISSLTKITIYDILGKEVNVLINKLLQAGRYEINWDASKFSSGVYFYRIHAGNYLSVKKMILNR